MNFNKLYEDIFKAATPGEVMKRKEQGRLEEFKEWMDENNIRYTIDNKGNIIDIIDYNKKDEYGNTPIMIATSLSIEEMVKLLLEKSDIILNTTDEYGLSMFSDISPNIAKILISSPKIDINMTAASTYKIPLISYIITFFNDRELFDMVLRNPGLDINKQDSTGRTPLMTATENHVNSSYKITKLLQAGADINIKDNKHKDWSDYINKYISPFSNLRREVMQLYRKYNKNKE